MIWFTSDLHLGHNRDFIYSKRGYRSIQEHDIDIINHINKLVKQDDTLYILGDLMLGQNSEYTTSLLKTIICRDIRIILGNHDSIKKQDIYNHLPNVTFVDYGYYFKYRKWIFILSHFPTIADNYDNRKYNYINLCGHTHSTVMDTYIQYNSLNIGLDACGMYPISIDEVLDIFIKLKDKE